MATKKLYDDYPRLVPEELTVYTHSFLNDFELLLLTNHLIYQELQVVMGINLHLKINKKVRTQFRIPYTVLEETTGMPKKLIKRHLGNLRQKNILVMSDPMVWKWNVPGIAKLLGPKPEVANDPYPEQTKGRETLNKVVMLHTAPADPILSGLPENWDKI